LETVSRIKDGIFLGILDNVLRVPSIIVIIVAQIDSDGDKKVNSSFTKT